MDARDIPIGKLRVRQDARPVDQNALTALVESVREIGFTCSILVRPRVIYESGQEAQGFEIIAGRHRFEAAQQLGMETMPCRVAEFNDLHAELAMLDENLRRAGYNSPAATAQAVARRKEIYEAIHPETRHGGDRRASRKDCDLNDVERFTASTASATGQKERTVQLHAERGQKISERALSLVQGTHLDTGTFLDKIKSLGPKEQEARVQRELAAPRKPISPAPAVRNEFESYQAFLNKVVKLFDPVPQEWRDAAIEHLQADQPVMDHRERA